MVPSGFCVREQCESEMSRVSARSEVLNPPMSSIPSGALLQFPVLPWCQGPERSLPARAAEVDTGNGWKWMTRKNNFKRTLSTHSWDRVRRVSLEFVGLHLSRRYRHYQPKKVCLNIGFRQLLSRINITMYDMI